MFVAFWAEFSWAFWFTWMAIGLAYEVFAVRQEPTYGTLPLTRVLRDRLMRRSTLVKLGMLLFLSWLWVHFILNVSW